MIIKKPEKHECSCHNHGHGHKCCGKHHHKHHEHSHEDSKFKTNVQKNLKFASKEDLEKVLRFKKYRKSQGKCRDRR